ncbi:hypothetical protein FRB96_009012 [Tulasnella sp. 330]|nr:hypothetical protein FRB96_009012 [Tulasnella sp. 330]
MFIVKDKGTRTDGTVPSSSTAPFFWPSMLAFIMAYGGVIAIPGIHEHGAPGKVAINGGSNGGALVAACVNHAPKGIFGAVVVNVGALDLLKT